MQFYITVGGLIEIKIVFVNVMYSHMVQLYTRMLRVILKKSWRQHPTRRQLYGHLPPITKTIQVRRARHAGHCWRSKDELVSDVLLWTPTYGQAKAGRPARTYIQQLCEDTGCNPEDLPEAMNDREKWRKIVKDIRAGGTTWWWWWWYTYTSNNKEERRLLKKYTSHFIWKGCVWEREFETKQNCYILTPHSYDHQRCVFLVLLMLNRRPSGPALCWLSLPHLVSNSSDLQLTGGSGGPLLPGGGFLYRNLSPTSLISNSLTSCLHRVI